MKLSNGEIVLIDLQGSLEVEATPPSERNGKFAGKLTVGEASVCVFLSFCASCVLSYGLQFAVSLLFFQLLDFSESQKKRPYELFRCYFTVPLFFLLLLFMFKYSD